MSRVFPLSNGLARIWVIIFILTQKPAMTTLRRKYLQKQITVLLNRGHFRVTHILTNTELSYLETITHFPMYVPKLKE